MASSFSVADPQTDKRIVNALNRSFDSIQEMVDNYKPQITEQNFKILNWKGEIRKDKSISVSEPADIETPVFCFYGNTLKFIGVLVGYTLTFTETIETTNEQGAKEPYQALIYMPYRTGVSRNPVKLTKDNFYKGNNRIQVEDQK